MMKKPDFNAHCIKVTLIFVNIIFWLSGCAILAVGLWLMVDPSVVRMAGIVHVSLVVNDSFIVVVATLFISLGIFALLVGLCGCCGAVRESKLLLSLYMLSLFLVAAGELTGGVYAVVRREEIKDSLVRNGVTWLSKDYLNDTTSRYFNSWMQEFRCCGVVDYTDFDNSVFSKTKANASWNCSFPAPDNANRTIPLPSPCCFAETISVTRNTWKMATFMSDSVMTIESHDYPTTETSMSSVAMTSTEFRSSSQDEPKEPAAAADEMPPGCVESLVVNARSKLLIVVLIAYLVVTVKVLGFAVALCLCRRIDAD